AAKEVCQGRVDEARRTLVNTARMEGIEGLNPNSHRQLSDLFFNKLKLPVIELTPTGYPSTREYVLKKLRGKHPVLDAQLEYRHWDKSNNFLSQYEAHQDEAGRMHPDYSLSFTLTGRTSSHGPNIQQMPRLPLIRQIV